MILMPTRGRPHSVQRFYEAYKATQATEPLCLLIDYNDPALAEYRALPLPMNFYIFISYNPGKGIASLFNEFFNRWPHMSYYGVMADDVVPVTPHWDQVMKNACMPGKLVWGNDGLQGQYLPTHPFLGGELVRKLGWLAHPELRHCFVDNVWLDIAQTLGCGEYLGQLDLPHYHHMNGMAEIDDTYRNVPSVKADSDVYARIREPLQAQLNALK